ncbi:MAG TPA: hypothetical protein IAC04_03795 [Candidatus Coprenecus stercoravium]|uniref:Outer membrane protein beta-barrel domain-containing protein n=1 Tax=Candidatus Coprenecus stercoravium TaxID=2840735 RepID=A0A9D2K9V8_9BACT|nr:hypothetical protein [Candidatus Coprenecus stercoravium]
MRKLYLILTAVLTAVSMSIDKAAAQNISEADFRQDGDKVIVSFYLDRNADISLYVSTDGGRTYQGPLKKVSGNVGNNVPLGWCAVTWDPIAEYGGITGDNIRFKITASPLKQRTLPSTATGYPGSINKQTTDERLSVTKCHNKSTGSQKGKFVRFGMGIGLGGLMVKDEDESVFTFSIPMELSLGRVDQRFNFAIGETFSFMKSTVQFTTVGILRLRALEFMYLGIGGGLNANVYTSTLGFLEKYDDLDLPESTQDVLPALSGAVIAEAGITIDNFDVALNYKYDFMGFSDLSGTLSVAFKYYF